MAVGLINNPNLSVAGTETPTDTPIDLGQLYQEWASLNPNASPADIFAAGYQNAITGSSPVGMGQVDDFSQMPYDPSMQPDAISQVDSFAEISGADDFTGVPLNPSVGGELGPGFNSPGYVQGGVRGTGVEPEIPERQIIDMNEFGIPTRRDPSTGN